MTALLVIIGVIGGVSFVVWAIGAIWASIDSRWPVYAIVTAIVCFVAMVPIGIAVDQSQPQRCEVPR